MENTLVEEESSSIAVTAEGLRRKRRVKAVNFETFICIVVLILSFGSVALKMGVGNMFNTIMNTSYDLLINTVFSIMAMAVLTGALSSLLSEFGVISLINKLFSILMKPIYNLPGASIAGAIATYLSDNPAIIAFAKDKSFTKYFKKHQVPALCNLGTAFGMGLILTIFIMTLGKEFMIPALIGNLGAIVGSIVSVRIMLRFTKKYYGYTEDKTSNNKEQIRIEEYREIRDGGAAQRILDSLLEGAKSGVNLGLDLIPGVLVVCTLVMVLTFGPAIDPNTGQAIYTGAAYEGIGLFPLIGEKLKFILGPLFGFQSSQAIAFPITALGSVGAAISLIPKFLTEGIITANDIAVFTAMGMCWSGYLSTHVGMMDALGVRSLTSKAILAHTVGGLCAGISAHLLYALLV